MAAYANGAGARVLSSEERLPVSANQRALWFLYQYAPDSSAYNMAFLARINPLLDVDHLRMACRQTIQRHAVLHTCFRQEHSNVVATVSDIPPMFFSHVVDLEREAIGRWYADFADTPFRLEHGEVCRMAVLDVEGSPACRYLAIAAHHIVADHYSLERIVANIDEDYAALTSSRTPAPTPSFGFPEWCLEQAQHTSSIDGEASLALWRARLEPLPDPLELPTDFPRPVRQGFAGEERVRRWDGDLASTIQSTARALGVTPYVLLLSAFQLLLGRLSGRERFLVGSPVMGRHGRRHRDLIGYCANPLLLPIDLSRVESFAAHVQHNQALRKEMARHERVPLATILEQLDLGRDAARTSVAPHMFTYTRHHDPAGFASGLGFELLHGGQRGAAHELNLVVNHRKDGFFAHWRYNQDLFDRETIDALAEDFEVLLHHLCAAPHVGYAGLTVSGWNSGPVAEPIQPATASALLEAVKADRPALLSGSNILSHGELRVRVDAVAAAFEEGGVGNSDPVGLLLPRSDAQIAAMFACWKLGAPFFALDPSQPAERINRLVTGAGCTVIAGQGQRPTWLTEQTSWITLDRISSEMQPANPIAPRPEDAAYLLSTSGSTGEPKRVLVSHSALAHYARALWDRLPLPHGTVFATLAAPSTDLGYTSLFGALLNGAAFRLIPEECMLDGEALAEHLAAHPVDVLKVVPSHFEALLALGGAALLPRIGLVFGGEAPSAALIETIARLAPDLAVFNHYGPTETTVGVTTDRLNVGQPIRLGRALRGNRLHVLDEALRPLPSGAEGDIYISGPQLARCYEGRADLTASAFVPDPFSMVPGARMYRSGDRGRRIGQQFAFAGRGDGQVKIRGNRVELGEVEAHLRTAPGVKDAAAIVIEHDGHKQIAACMVDGSVEEVSSFLRDHLPEAMIPSRWQILERLPRLPNGKVDRQEIASGFPRGEVAPTVPQVANATALECLRDIWKSVLRQPEIAKSDNFFAIGGDSILALQLVAAAKRAGLKLTVQDIFQHQQLDALARVVGVTAGAVIPTASSAPGARNGRLAPIQAWFFANQRQAPDHWNQSLLLKAVSWPSPDVLKAALDWLLVRHPMLTTLYAQHEDGWRMGSTQLASKGIFEVIDVADIDDAAKTCDAAERSLSITDGPVFLARLIRCPGHDTQLFLTAHHLAVDGVSWRVIANDLIHACDTLASGSSLEPCSADHRYLAWAASKSPQADIDADCYHERLLPYTDPGLTGLHGNSRRHQIVLDSQLTARFGSGGGARVRDRLIAAWLDAWTAVTDCTETLIDIEEHGRDSDHADCVGWFTSRFPVLFEPADLPSTDDDAIRERLAAVPSAVRSGALLHKEQMLRAECSINYLGLLDGGMDGVTIEPRPLETMRDAASCRTNAITIDGWLAGGRLSVELSFAGERYSASFAAILAERFEQALRAMASAVSDDDEARAAMLRLDPRIEHVWPMTSTQRGILFECLRSGERDLYANVTVFRLAGEFDAERLRLAWLTVIGRHPMTRASADWLGFDEPRLIIRRGLKSDIFVEHHTIKAEEDEASLIDMIVAQQRQTGFDLERGPLMRLGLITIGPQRGLLVWARHHLIVDGWTSALLLEDLLRAYHSAPADPIPSLETYFDWLGRQDRRTAEAAWKNYLSGHEVATVSQRPGSSAATDVHALNWEGDQALADRLRHLARSQSVTLANVLQFAWSCALAFERGSYDVLTGVTVSGRPADLDGADRMAGVFIASLPLRVKLDPRLSVGEGLRAMQIASAPLRDAFFLGMADIQRVAGIDPGQALFDTLLVIENYPHPDQVRLGGAEVTLLRTEERSQFGLMAQIQSLETLAATFRINRAQFDLQEGERISARFRELLSALGREGVEAVCIPALLSCEIGEFVPSAILGSGVVDGLVSSFGAHGERVALVDGSGALGYGELSDLALGIARGLRASGVEAEDLVAVHLGRDRMLVAALLGVLLSGAAYVPLDPAQPAARLTDIVEQARPRLAISSAPLAGCERWMTPEALIAAGKGLTDWCPSSPHPEQRAYVIFTSGSTGRPKGVTVRHGAFGNLLWSMADKLALSPDDRWLAVTTVGFDIAALELVGPLLCGARVILADESVQRDAGALVALAEREGANLVQATPASWQMLAGEESPIWPGLRALCGGEALPASLAEQLLARGVRLFNVYGPTETTIWSSAVELAGPVPTPSAPLGEPLAATGLYVLDDWMRPVPPGGEGELCIAGLGLARGYHDRPDLTAPAFVPDPFSATPGARMYRTGDVVRRTREGTLLFVRRRDHQIKLRGHRIELGEIEAALLADPAVHAAVATLREAPSGAFLAAYVTTQGDLDTGALRARLAERLPAYMLPTTIDRLDALPLNTNGKVDRKALPEPGITTTQPADPPATDTERWLAALWHDILGTLPTSKADNFFLLGANSLHATKLVARLRRERGCDISLGELFSNPTLGGLAAFAAARNPTSISTDLAVMASLLDELE